jgi:hypothetical protein
MKEIILTKGFIAFVSDEDFDFVVHYSWYADAGKWTTYAKNDKLPGRPRLHTAIMKPENKLIVHHRDGNGLNNTRENLEIMTQMEHARLSKLRRTKAKFYLGLFDTEQEAALAYNQKSFELFGDKAVFNDIDQMSAVE